MKFFLIITTISITLILGVLNLLSAPTRIIPYPYYFKGNAIIPPKVQESTILIVGDRLAQSLKIFEQQLREEIMPQASDKIKIYNWSADGEGLHRTIQKLTQLDKYPPLVIYFGSSQEFIEQKWHLSDYDNIIDNFKRYNNAKILTSILIYPPLSKILYHQEQRVALDINNITKQRLKLTPKQFIKNNILLFKLFETEIDQLFQLSLDKQFKLLVIIPPLNLDIPIQNNCLGPLTPEDRNSTKKIQNLLSKGEYQTAYNEALILFDRQPNNGWVEQLLAMTLKGLGKTKQAIYHLQKATTLDCDYWRGTQVFNAILRKKSNAYGINFLDFDRYLLKYYGKNLLFFDSIYPQRIFYEKFIKQLAQQAQMLLQIN